MTVTQKIPVTAVSFAIDYDSGEKKKKASGTMTTVKM